MRKEESTAVQYKLPCLNDDCGSSDAVVLYSDGHGHCFSCGSHFQQYDEDENVEVKPMNTTAFVPQVNVADIQAYPIKGFRERVITRKISEFFDVRSSLDVEGNISSHFYPFTSSGTIVAYKERKIPKEFLIHGQFKSVELFGQSKFRKTDKRLVITEGELDAMSVAQAFDEHYNQIYPVVSLPNGAQNLKPLRENRKWIRQFEEVILWFDDDEAGDEGLRKAAKIIGYDKIKLAKANEKDASDTLVRSGYKEVLKAIWDAKEFSPSGIINDPAELWTQLEEYNKIESIPYPDCLSGLNDKVKGMRQGEITLWTSGTGSGKSTLLREIMLHLLETTNEKIGLVSLEEAPAEAARKLAGMAIKRNPAKEEIPLGDLKVGFDNVFGSNRVIVLDHQGAINDGSIVETLEAMCVMGAKYLFVDHITILCSEGADGLTGNEAIDVVMNQLLGIAKRHQVWIGLVSHLRKMSQSGQSFEAGKLASLDDIRGSGSIKQISFDILAFSRNLNAETEEERNVIKMAVLKSRYTGLTGPCGTALYNYDTGRLSYGGFMQDSTTAVLNMEL